MFRVIIAGTRTFNNYEKLKLDCNKLLSEKILNNEEIIIISGCANGADKLGEKYAKENGFKINKYPADWNLGKQAGYLRNVEMADNADALIAFWDSKSKGTQHMIAIAKNRNLLIRVIKI